MHSESEPILSYNWSSTLKTRKLRCKIPAQILDIVFLSNYDFAKSYS